MLFYLGVFLTIVVMRFAMGEYARTNKRIYQLVLAILFVVSAFRFETGCDWFGYEEHYLDQKAETFADAFAQREWLWYVFLELHDMTGLDYVWINVFTTAAFFAGITVFARRQLDPVGFLVLLFPIEIMNLPMSGIRQGVAVALICVAFTAFLDRRPVKFIVWTLIAGSIHTSGFLFLFLVPFCFNLRPGVQVLTAGLLAVPGAYFILTGSAADLALSRYADTDSIEAAGASYRVALVLATGTLFLLFFRRAWAQLFPQDFLLYFIGALMMVAAGALLLLSSVIADRVGYYLVPLQIAILARIPYLLIRSGRPLFFLAPYAVYTAVFVGWMAVSSLFQLCYVPYESWIFG